ncbi:MAG TPA: polysaccharide biosynthesis tyrosine autokinase [Gaiellaceae bacterium]|nr:polysaccharide biosynthesis tyrosine autokinase [Gaiellaceae bacterium]
MSDVRETEGTGIGLRQYLEVLRRRKLIVISFLAISLGAASALTLATTSLYEAQTTIVVGQGTCIVQPQNANAIQPFTATAAGLMHSTVLANNIIHDLKLNYTPQGLLGNISVSFNPDSAALTASVVNHDPLLAKSIARSLGTNFQRLVQQRLGKEVPAAAGVPPTAPLTACIWDPAHVVPGKVEPKPTRNLLVAGILGLVLGLLAAFLRDYFDRTLRTVEEIERAFGVPVIGQIPSVKPTNRGERSRILWEENGDFAESFRGLRANLQYLAVQWPLKTILVTSPAANQGKTTVCASLATAIAQSRQSVVLIEADLRRPRLGETFGLPRLRPGLTSVLVGHSQLGRATSQIPLPPTPGQQKGQETSITVLPSGPLPPNPSELVGSPRMRRLVDGLADLYDTVILDSPPLLPVADSLALAKLVDGVIIVVRAKNATRDDAKAVRALADRLGLHVIGVVVTDVPRRDHYYAEYTSELVPEEDAVTDDLIARSRKSAEARSARKAAM